MEFTSNHVTKFYWILLLFMCLPLLAMKVIGCVLYLVVLGFAVRSMTSQVIVSGNRLTSKNIFKERTINILPESRIYICRNMQSINFVLRFYDYSIKIVNPDETLKINANVNDADTLYQIVAGLEQKHILPVWLERFSNQPSLALDDNLTMTRNGIKYKNKVYLYDNLSGMKLESGYFRLMANGKLWQTALLALPVSAIPNIVTFMTLMNQVDIH
ncbi:MAG: hypothetical protein KGO49_05330 [Gammaproteobacteria bacterium]|nr:hypothetical protein [Gammaproteobacteria bacterium]